jgi:TolB protein
MPLIAGACLLAFCAGCGGGRSGTGGTPTVRRVAFVSDRDGNPEIYTMAADGSDPRRLTNNPANDNSAAWSPNGQKIAFVSDRDGGDAEVYIMNPDGTGQTNLTNRPGPDGGPSWSPDGTRIAYVVGGQDVAVMNADGTGKSVLTTDPAVDGGPVWSPDGTQIYFVSNRGSAAGTQFLLYVMNADGSNQRAVGAGIGIDGRPSVSPDGRRIAYATADPSTPTEPDIWVIGSDGSAPRKVGPHFSGEPAWTPNGQSLTFTRFDIDSNAEIYTMSAGGANPIRLTRNTATDGGAAW